MPVFALPVLALGLLVAAWGRSARGDRKPDRRAGPPSPPSMVGLGLLGEARAPDQIELTELQVRSALEAASPVLARVSAPGQLAGLAKALAENAAPTGAAALWSLGLTACTLGLATAVARIRGPA